MSDLKEELMRMAVDGADKARPLAIAEVMRRGNRRRTRTIGQRSIGSLSVLSVSAAVIVAGAVHPFHGAASHPASGTAGVTTLIETTASAAGLVTIEVKYRNGPPGKVKLLGVTFAGTTTASIRRPALLVEFGPIVRREVKLPAPGCGNRQTDGIIRGLRLHKNHSFSGSLRINFDIPPVKGIGIACDGTVMRVSVLARNSSRPLLLLTALTEAFVLDR